MNYPSFSYPLRGYPNAPVQAVSSSDRPLCSLVSAYAELLRGSALGGSARLLSHGEQLSTFERLFAEHDVPLLRAESWVLAINRSYVPHTFFPHKVGPFTLDPYQIETIRQTAPSGGVLALGCGLGKTVTAIALALRAQMYYSAEAQRTWVVCPLNAIPAWERMRAYVPGEYQIISMDSLHKVVDALPSTGGTIIFDEAHLLGEMSARRTKAAHRMRAKFDAGFCLTGTLLHGGIEKALSIQDLAVPGLARFSSRWKAGEFFKCLSRHRIGGRMVTELMRPTGLAKKTFMEYLALGCVSMTKDSAIVRQTMDVPPQEIHTVELGDCTIPLDQLAADCALQMLEEDGDLPNAQAVAHRLCSIGVSEKVDWLLNEMDDPSIQVVVFAAYRATLDAVAERLTAEGITFVRVDGDTLGKDRAACEADFQQGKARVFLGQQVAASVSMNLQNAYISVTLDHDWKASNYDQSLARTCRRGQTRTCYHFDLVANKVQQHVVDRLREAADFDASSAEYQDLKRGLLTVKGSTP